jgi:hypothetical protein
MEGELGTAGVHRVEVGPLGLSATRRLLSQCLGLTLPPRLLSRLFDATQGNPLLALELGRALAGGQTWAIGAELTVADLADEPFGARVAELAEPARRALLAAALSGHLSLSQLMAVADPVAAEDLVAGGLLILEGERVRLSHPLLAAAARRKSRIGERRALHLALAEVAQDETLRVASPPRLVVSGFYRYVRNPIYLGFLAVLAGEVLLFGSPGLLEYTALSWCIGAAAVRFYEEPVLARKFGAEYQDYRRAVRAGIPRLHPWTPGQPAGPAVERRRHD